MLASDAHLETNFELKNLSPTYENCVRYDLSIRFLPNGVAQWLTIKRKIMCSTFLPFPYLFWMVFIQGRKRMIIHSQGNGCVLVLP
jgi:hypothetical protein